MQTYNLKEQLRGDTFPGVSFTVSVNGSPKNLTNTEIKIEFRFKVKRGKLIKTLTVGSGITKLDAVNGVFCIDSFVVDFEEGVYYYDIQFKDGAVIKTYIGGIWVIDQDVTV